MTFIKLCSQTWVSICNLKIGYALSLSVWVGGGGWARTHVDRDGMIVYARIHICKDPFQNFKTKKTLYMWRAVMWNQELGFILLWHVSLYCLLGYWPVQSWFYHWQDWSRLIHCWSGNFCFTVRQHISILAYMFGKYRVRIFSDGFFGFLRWVKL